MGSGRSLLPSYIMISHDNRNTILRKGALIMKNYVKPAAFANSDLAEGVFMASGADGGFSTGCYTVSAYITQTPEGGRTNYCIQVNAAHDADHHGTAQILTLHFNLPISYVSSNGSYMSGNGTTELKIAYAYHANFTENHGLGDVYVTADAGLSITGASLACNTICAQHDGLNN